MKSRQYTENEVRKQFLDHVRMLVDYWDKETSRETTKKRLDGLAFSILAAIDGSSVSLPSFVLAPLPHENNKQYRINNKENYYPENHDSNVKCDIAGSLHDSFYEK